MALTPQIQFSKIGGPNLIYLCPNYVENSSKVSKQKINNKQVSISKQVSMSVKISN